MEKDFYTIREFAELLGVHPQTVRRSIKQGKIAAVKIGSGERSCYRISKTEIDRMYLIDLTKIVKKMVKDEMEEKATN